MTKSLSAGVHWRATLFYFWWNTRQSYSNLPPHSNRTVVVVFRGIRLVQTAIHHELPTVPQQSNKQQLWLKFELLLKATSYHF